MNSNRNRYASAPTYGMQKRTPAKKSAARKPAASKAQGQQPMPVQGGMYAQQPGYPGMMPNQPGYPGMMPNQSMMPPQNPYGYQYADNPVYPTPSAGGTQVHQQMGGYPPVAQPPVPPMYPPQTSFQQPPQAPVQPRKADSPRKDTWLQILLLAVLPILFIAAMITKQPPLFWVFIGFASVGLIAMWVQSTFVSSARTTLSLIYGALLIVSAVTLLSSGGAARDTGKPQQPPVSQPVFNLGTTVQQPQMQTVSGGIPTDITLENVNQPVNPYLIEYTPEPSEIGRAHV